MKEVIRTLLKQAQALIEETIGEVRERCCDPTHAKFVALHSAIGDAIREGALETPVDAAAAPAPSKSAVALALREVLGDEDPVQMFTGLAEMVSNHLGDRIALEVRAALDEHKAG